MLPTKTSSVGLLTLTIAVVGSNALVLSPIAGEVARSLPGTEASHVMLASAVYGAATAVSALSLAPQADRFGLRKALLVAMLVTTLGLALSAMSQSLIWLCLAQALTGAAAGVALPAIYGLAADVSPKGRESEILGKVLTGWTISLVAGVSLSALLADALHWRAVYASLATAGALIAVALINTMPAVALNAAPLNPSPIRALRIKGVGAALMSVCAYMMAFYGLYAFLGTHLQVNLGLSTSMAGLATLFYGVGFGIVAPIDSLIDRYGAINARPVVFALLITAYLLIALIAASPWGVIGACLLWGAANHLGLNLLVGQLTAIDLAQRASVMGLYSAASYGAMFVGTTLFKPFFETNGFALTACLAAVCVTPALVQAVLSRNRHVRAVSS